MPLLPATLYDGLMQLDSDGGAKDLGSATQRIFDAWWGFASQMTYLNPATLVAAKALVMGPFIGVLTPAMQPSASDAAFWNALNGAMVAAWASLGTPATLTPPLVSATPPVAPLYPLISGVAQANGQLMSSPAARLSVATVIYTWTLTGIVIGPTGPVGPFT